MNRKSQNSEEELSLEENKDFIREQIRQDLSANRVESVITRFPPEPNGHLHIGHAKSICLNFGVAEEFGGRCHLRLDDTNPVNESQDFVEAIVRDVKWLGYDWGNHLYFASDNFEKLYEWAEYLIRNDKAYVDDLSPDQIREFRGTLTEPGKDSPFRNRSSGENLELFRKMRDGAFEEAERVLRAKIDMASGNINLRDPVLYRIINASHPRTGEKWSIYPTYDFAHGQSDAIEHITHSLCTLEFADHRPLYDWLIENLPVPSKPRQFEFSRLNLSHTVLSKRLLIQLVEDGHVAGWDDPRMPTISGLRRRGFPAAAIRDFASRVGVTKSENMIEMAYLESCVRENLNKSAERRLAVLRPLKITIENYPENQTEELDAVNNPEDPEAGTRKIKFSKELYIEREDFMEDPPRKFFRMAPGREVRLRYAYYITCNEVVKNEDGDIVELLCSYDPETRGGDSPDGRKVKATLHWVSAQHANQMEVRLYENLFSNSDPSENPEFLAGLNPESLTVLDNCWGEASLAEFEKGQPVQFERLGYFTKDPDSTEAKQVFNRSVALRDSWAKIQAKGKRKN